MTNDPLTPTTSEQTITIVNSAMPGLATVYPTTGSLGTTASAALLNELLDCGWHGSTGRAG